MYSFCTYFNYNYLPIGLTLIDSIKEHCKPFKLYILCLDEKCYEYFKKENIDNIIIILLNDLESWQPNLLQAKANRTEIEYYWTCTPCILAYILHRFKEEQITYLDADQYFLNSPESVFEEITNCSVAIMPHRFPNYLEKLEIYGKYNVSWLTFKNNEDSTECLKWWLEKCISWCFANISEDKYGDQKYLDVFQEKFKKVHIIKNKGCGMAPWNWHIKVNEKERVLYHFQSLRIRYNFLFQVHHEIFNFNLNNRIKKTIYIPYIKELRKNLKILSNKNYSSNTKFISCTPISELLSGEYLVYLFGKCMCFQPSVMFNPALKLLSKIKRRLNIVS